MIFRGDVFVEVVVVDLNVPNDDGDDDHDDSDDDDDDNDDCDDDTLGSLSTRVFETRTATGREHFARQGIDIPQIFILIIFNGEKILSSVNVVV